jgi:hypothetical protein
VHAIWTFYYWAILYPQLSFSLISSILRKKFWLSKLWGFYNLKEIQLPYYIKEFTVCLVGTTIIIFLWELKSNPPNNQWQITALYRKKTDCWQKMCSSVFCYDNGFHR